MFFLLYSLRLRGFIVVFFSSGFVVWTTVAIAVTFLVYFCGYRLYDKGERSHES